MRRLLPAVLCLSVSFSLAASASAAPRGKRIVGGIDTSITSVPWQVLVHAVVNGSPTFCGGSILDATHVVTAAHCAHRNINNPNSPVVPAAAYTIVSGTSHVSPLNPQPANTDPGTTTFSSVSNVAPDPRYPIFQGNDFDVAVLTLSAPLVLDGVYRRAATLATVPSPAGAPVTVSGWGDTTQSPDTEVTPVGGTLQSTTLRVVDFNTCNAAYGNPFTQGTIMCAAEVAKDSCGGDSGGPLVDAAGVLVGLVSGGPDACGTNVNSPGYYTAIASCQVRGFITNQMGSPGPQPCDTSTIAGPAAIGGTLACTPGTYATPPASLAYSFVDQAGTILQTGPAGTYVVTRADGEQSRTITCRVAAVDTTGTSTVTSGGGIGPIPPPPVDRTAPRSSVSSGKCTRTQCILRLTVQDLGYSEGIASLRATRRTTVTLKKMCKVKGKRRHCTRTTTRTLTAVKTATGYTVTASKLAYGTHRFSFRAVDNAGNTQPVATTRTLKTRAPRKR